jgi:hypothetical protein
MVSGITIRHGDPHSLIIAESAEKAEEIFLKDEEDGYIMSTYAWEITEIDGYKIVFHKGKKIALIK